MGGTWCRFTIQRWAPSAFIKQGTPGGVEPRRPNTSVALYAVQWLAMPTVCLAGAEAAFSASPKLNSICLPRPRALHEGPGGSSIQAQDRLPSLRLGWGLAHFLGTSAPAFSKPALERPALWPLLIPSSPTPSPAVSCSGGLQPHPHPSSALHSRIPPPGTGRSSQPKGSVPLAF